jgi:RNA methyltransferase, TrmH family
MSIRIVQSKQNARLKELRRALSNPGRNERGLVGIEGPNLIAEAVRSGLRVECIFVGEGIGVSQDVASTAAADTDILLVPNLKSMLATETPQPIAALIEPPDWTWAHFFGDGQSSSTLIVVLAGVQDPGNLGTIVRSAEAFGANGVLCLPGTVSAWNSKAVRASAGSVFRLPILAATEEDAIARLREAGVKMIATTVDGAEPANLTDLTGPVALLIGNEGNGVPADLAAKADGAITIPCPGPVESLNAAVAASVLLYEASRQRSLTTGPQAKGGVSKARHGGIR